MYGVGRNGRIAIATIAALSLGASLARAEDSKQKLELRGGDKLEGKILCVSARHVVFDGPGGPRFVERSTVLVAKESDGATIDLAARETQTTRDLCGLFLEIFNEKLRVNRGEQSFEPTALSSEKGLASALLRTGDELRTGPWGRAKVLLPKGTQLSANRDAVVQFAETGPVVLRGSARFKDGDVNVAIPEGRVSGKTVDVALNHTGGRTQITCYQGTCEVEGDGWRLDLFKNHTVDVSNGRGDQSPYVAANAANSFPIDLKVGTKRLQVQPGQTVCLVVIRSSSSEPRPAEPAREPARRDPGDQGWDDPPRREKAPPRDDPPVAQQPAESTGGVGRVLKATDAFWHIRSATQQWKIAADRSASVVLKPGDEVATEDARVTLAFDRPQASIDLNINTSLVVPQDDAFVGSAAFKVKRGQVTARATSGTVALSVPGGEVSVQEGESIVSASNVSTKVRAREGRSVLRVGRDVVADVSPGVDVAGGVEEGKTKLEASGKGASFVRIASVLNVTLPASKALECGRNEDGSIWLVLWNNGRIEADGSVEATIEEQDGVIVCSPRASGGSTAVPNGARRTVEPGAVVKLVREVAAAPRDPVQPPVSPTPERRLIEAPAQPDTPPVSQTPGRTNALERAAPIKPGTETRTLSNGAVLTLVNWGTLTEKPASAGLVEVDGPGSSPLVLGPGTRLTLRRMKNGDAVVLTEDRRQITWVKGAQTASFTLRLLQDGKLSIDLPDDRSLAVEKGATFELELRADGRVQAGIVHQTIFVEKGQHLAVNVSSLKVGTADMAKAQGGSK